MVFGVFEVVGFVDDVEYCVVVFFVGGYFVYDDI